MLKLTNISKSFPGVRALDDVSVEFRAGEVHALLGENGAGKSSLIKIISGAYTADSGTISINGEKVNFMTPHKALSAGISTIYQEFNLVPELTVAENIFFGREFVRSGFLDKKKMISMAKNLCKEVGVGIDPSLPVRKIGVAGQQIVEIVKAVSQESRILVMDEPTAPLTNKEIDLLFSLVRKLKERGTSVIFITHRLEEVFEICDRVTVLRDGTHVATSDTAGIDKDQLIRWMVGRTLEGTYPSRDPDEGSIILSVEGLTNFKLRNLSFHLKKGEILGIAGLVGSGRTSLGRAIFGADELDSGTILMNGKALEISSPKDGISNRIGLLPEDRKHHGLILGFPIAYNMSFAALKSFVNKGFLKKNKEKNDAISSMQSIGIKAPSHASITQNLSGGNQQKVVLAKWLATHCEVLIFDEPTRGIDVGAKAEIYEILANLTRQGKSIIMISSEMPELIGMADRIMVMNNGRIGGILSPEEYDQHTILEIASRSIIKEPLKPSKEANYES